MEPERDREALELPRTAAGRAVASLLAGGAGPSPASAIGDAVADPRVVDPRVIEPAGSEDRPPAAAAAKPAWLRPGVRTGARERLVYPLRQLVLFGANRVVGRLPGHRLRLAYYRHALGWTIGERSSIHYGLQLYGGRGRVTIGDRSTIQIGCLFAGVGMSDLAVGDDVAIAYRTTIILGGHDVHSPDFEMILAPVVIEDRVFVGANATILGGVTLGEGSVVGAGAVVGKSVPPYAVVTGNPAKVVGERRRDLRYSAEHRWPFH
ncbi:MAG TPA: acyltransferase [Candidatus Binatia bacterium]|nr:acyltransferase [Candidatus Binatia bacterium]